MTKPKTRSEKRKDRIQHEKEFLSAVLADIDYRDIRRAAYEYGVSWRRFMDKRHRALWRAIQALDLSSNSEARIKTLIEESGDPDIYDDRGAMDRLLQQAKGRAWLEHELAAAGVLAAVGGKKYLREVVDEYAAGAAAGELARLLGFAQGGEGD